MKRYSLTRRLIVAVLLVELASAVAMIMIAGVYESVTHLHALDVVLRGRADSILGSVQDAEDKEDSVMLDGSQSRLPQNDVYLVLDDQGRTVGRSNNWTGSEAALTRGSDKQPHTIELNGHEYRVLRTEGVRVVDAEDPRGGQTRHVVIYYGVRTHGVWEQVLRAVAFYAGASLLLLLLTGLLMYRLLRSGLAPLRELAGQAGSVSVRSWHFAPSAEARAMGELAPLIAALETVLAGLERSFAQQARFVSDAAHELKTSVAVLKSSLQVLAMRQRTPAEYETGLERLQGDCARMEELVASMLTLAGLEAAEQPAGSLARTDLGEVVRDVAHQFAPLAEVARIELKVQATEVWVRAERDQVRLLCTNLVHNALQHSTAGHSVRVVAERPAEHTAAPGMGELQVTDEGVGIAPEVMPYVFDRFYRGDPSRSRRTGGTGLGLAISKAIAIRFHGDIHLESELGEGTKAVVHLPLATDLAPVE